MEGRTHEQLRETLRRLAERSAEGLGLEVVELVLRGPSRRRLLRVDIDRAGPGGVDLEDCKRMSDALGAAVDEVDALRERYVLEVSSPGIDRPIRSPDDIRRNTGRRVVVTTLTPVSGQRRFCGTLRGSSEGVLQLDDERLGPVGIPLESVELARQHLEF